MPSIIARKPNRRSMLPLFVAEEPGYPELSTPQPEGSQVDGTRLIEQYSDLGLLLAPAENAVEAGLYAVWERLSDGRLFVFSSLQNWLSEFRIYRRDEKGKIVKQNDHLMDATRYLILSGL